MEVQKLGIPEAKRAIQNITINISGPNARFNHQSIDNSTNVVQIDSGAIEILESIRQEVAKLKLPAQESNAAHEVLEAVEEQFKLGSPKRTVVSALLAALPHVATIAKLIKALIDRC